jgi:hypothetical protein
MAARRHGLSRGRGAGLRGYGAGLARIGSTWLGPRRGGVGLGARFGLVLGGQGAALARWSVLVAHHGITHPAPESLRTASA